MSADEIAYWDDEARNDPRYAAARWGMNGFEDADETIEQILRILDKGMPEEDGAVVEIGCGPGRLLHRMADLYGEATFDGFDVSPEMGRLFWADPKRVPPNAKFWLCQPRGRLFPDACIDFVYCVELFQHLDDEMALHYLTEARRMLAPRRKFMGQFVTAGEPGPHSSPRTKDEIIDLFRAAGFTHAMTMEVAVHPDWLWVTCTT